MALAPIAIDPDGWSPFVTARWAFVSVVGFAAAGMAIRYGTRPLDRSMQRAWAVVVAGLVAATCVTALGAGDLPTALVGEPARHLGLVTWGLCWLAFTAGQQFTGDAASRLLARAACVASALIGAWCIWELAGGRPIDVDVETRRLLGPYGSAAYLGAACCLLLPITIGVALDRSERRPWRCLAAAAAVGGAVGVVGSGSRAAWLSLAAVGSWVAWARRPVGLRPRLRVAAVAAALVVVPVAVLAPRLDDLVTRAHGASSRIDEWRVAARVLIEHPLGIGPEGYRIAIADGVDAAYERAYDRDDALPDRAHSGPIDVALAGGVLGGAAWLALMVLLARRARHAITGPVGVVAPAHVAGMAAGVIAYGLAQLVLFPIGEIDPVWWLLAGAVVARRAAPGPAEAGGPIPLRRLVGAGAGLAAVVALVAGVLDLSADRHAQLAITALATDPQRAVREVDRAVALRPDDTHRRLLAALLHAARGTIAELERALDHARAAERWARNDPEVRTMVGTLLLDLAAATGDPGDVAAARAHWTAMVATDPHRASWQLDLGRAAALDGDADAARTAWQAAVALDPDDEQAAALLARLDAAEAQTAGSPP